MFYCEFYEIFENSSFIGHLRESASAIQKSFIYNNSLKVSSLLVDFP